MPPGRAPRLPSDAVALRLVALYVQAEKKLDQLIAEAARRGAKGTATYYMNQQASVHSVLRDLERKRRPLSAAVGVEAYRSGVRAVDTLLNPGEAFSGVHTASEEVVAANLEDRLRYGEEFIGRKTPDVFRAAALESVGVQIAAGIGPRDQTKDLVAKLRKEGVTAFVDKAGRRWPLSTYAAMVTRTTTREAVSVGIKNRLLEAGYDLVMISEHLGACPICRPLQGKTYSLTGRDSRYPKLEKLPPFHPNCRHVLLPSTVSFEDMEKALFGEKAKRKAKPSDFKPSTPQNFRLAFDKALSDPEHGKWLTDYPIEEIEKSKPYLNNDGTAGGMVHTADDGVKEAVSLFNQGGAKGSGRAALRKLVKDGGARRLDCIGDVLRKLYEGVGFRVSETIKWDDRFAPDGWDYVKNGRPNIYVMEIPEEVARAL